MKKSHLTILAVASISLPAVATADNGFYVNGGVGHVSADLDLNDIQAGLGSESASTILVIGRAGYQFADFFAIEAEGGFGLDGDSIDRTVPLSDPLFGTVDVNLNADVKINNYFGVFARGILPVTDNIDVFARAGYGSVEVEADATATALGLSATDSVSDRANDFAYGAGAELGFGAAGNHGLRFDGTIVADGEFFSLSYSYRF